MARLASFDAAEGTWKRLVEYIDLESLCSPRGTLRPLTEDERIVGFRLEVIAPFSRATITVSDSGDVTYQAKPEGRPGQHGTGTVPRGTVAALAQWVQQSTFWTSKLSYDDTEDGMTLSDLSTYVVSVLTIGGEKMPATRTKRHSISCYGETESCPDDVVELIRRIKALWGKEIMDIGV
jgi:hypothetical protein